jgi:hypothetical protein
MIPEKSGCVRVGWRPARPDVMALDIRSRFWPHNPSHTRGTEDRLDGARNTFLVAGSLRFSNLLAQTGFALRVIQLPPVVANMRIIRLVEQFNIPFVV